MVRRQDCEPAYKIFGEFFSFPKKYNKMFLGKKINFFIQDDLCNIDIDTKIQMKINEKIIQFNKKFICKIFTHKLKKLLIIL